MRVVAEIPHPECKISIFFWNQRYLIKFERGACEQTYKVGELDVANLEDLKSRLIESDFITKAVARFEGMHEDLGGLF